MKKLIPLLFWWFVIASPVLASEKLSVSECVQDATSSHTAPKIDGMFLASNIPTLGLVTVHFKGDFIATNQTKRRQGVGGTLFLMRELEIIDRVQIYFPVGPRETIFLPLSLHVFDYPNASQYTDSVWWAVGAQDKNALHVNCRSLTAIIE